MELEKKMMMVMMMTSEKGEICVRRIRRGESIKKKCLLI